MGIIAALQGLLQTFMTALVVIVTLAINMAVGEIRRATAAI